MDSKQVDNLNVEISEIKTQLSTSGGSSGNMDFLKPEISLSNWTANGCLYSGINHKGWVNDGQLSAYLKRFYIGDIDGAFNVLPININPLEGLSVNGSKADFAFYSTNIPDFKNVNMPYITSAASMFALCKMMTTVTADFSKVSIISNLFNGCVNLVDANVILGDNITAADCAFKGCAKIAAFPKFKWGKITTMQGIFNGCTQLPEEYPDTIDLSSVTTVANLTDMFANTNVKKVNLFIPAANTVLRSGIGPLLLSSSNNVNTINAVDENGNVVQLNNLLAKSFSAWWTGGAVVASGNLLKAVTADDFSILAKYDFTAMDGFMNGNTTATGLPDKLSTGKCTSGLNSFKGTIIKRLPDMDLSKLTTMLTFGTGAAFTDFTRFDTSNCTNFNNAFSGNVALTDASANMAKATDITAVFKGCTALTNLGDINAPLATAAVDILNGTPNVKSKVNINLASLTTAIPTAFTGFGGAIGTLNMPKVVNIDNLFNGSFLTGLDVANFDLATSATALFNANPYIKYIGTLNIPKFVGTYQLLKGCTALESFGTVNMAGTSMFEFFAGCAKLTTVGALDLSKVTYTAHMFDGCAKLANLQPMDTSKVNNMSYMFNGCASLPAVFPFTIDMTGIGGYDGCMYMFEGTPVTDVTVKWRSATTPPAYISPVILGSGVQKVTIVDGTGAVIEVRDRNYAISLSATKLFSASGNFIVPPGITQVKVAATASWSYGFSGSYSMNGSATQTDCKFGDKLASLPNVGFDTYGDYMQSIDTANSKCWGYQPKFDAVYNAAVAGGYSCGCTTQAQNGSTWIRTYAVGKPSLNQGFVNVNPGDTIPVTIGAGGGAPSTNNNVNPSGHCTGFVLVGFSWDNTYKQPAA